ncbi:hypothetical protein MAR_013271 [Mya arenaria]|uniref:Uncharacterized protein n=1 Tax=Mya arenaria TaxID=6604 RepID=A0ABY7G2N4_MYAAR|nr:hypothetical protein MAR_013271 [Mya arenaria]
MANKKSSKESLKFGPKLFFKISAANLYNTSTFQPSFSMGISVISCSNISPDLRLSFEPACIISVEPISVGLFSTLPGEGERLKFMSYLIAPFICSENEPQLEFSVESVFPNAVVLTLKKESSAGLNISSPCGMFCSVCIDNSVNSTGMSSFCSISSLFLWVPLLTECPKYSSAEWNAAFLPPEAEELSEYICQQDHNRATGLHWLMASVQSSQS